MSGKKPSDVDTVSIKCAQLLVNAGRVAKKAGSNGTCTSKELLAKVKRILKPENLDQALVKDFEELEQRIALLEEQNKVLEEYNKGLDKHNKVLEDRNKVLEERNKVFEEYNKVFEDRNKVLEEYNKVLEEHNKIFEGKHNVDLVNKIKRAPKPDNPGQGPVTDFEELDRRIVRLEAHYKELEEQTKELELRLHPSDNQGPNENHFSTHDFSTRISNKELIARLAQQKKQYELWISREP